MARTPSTMLALGTPAPKFSLPDTVSGKIVTNLDFASKPLLIMFICNHCPFVKHVRFELAKLGKKYSAFGVGICAISSNDIILHPQDSPAMMKLEAEEAGYSFPYLYDETQSVAKAFDAACTPDYFLFDREHRLVYRGQLDDSRPGNSIPVSGKDLRTAIDNLLAGKPISHDQRPSLGCNIKWK